VTQQVLDAMAQCRRGRRAPGTGSLHIQIDHAVLESAEGDIAAVIRHGWSHPRFDQLFYRRDGLGILGLEELFALRCWRGVGVPLASTARPGRNLSVAGFGVGSV